MIRRRGWSLLEMTVVVALMGVLLSLAGLLLANLFRVQREFQRDSLYQASEMRVSTQLRADAHAALQLVCPDPEHCELTLPRGQLIRYEITDEGIHREVREKDAVLHRDAFSLPASVSGSFSVQKSGSRSLVRLTLHGSSNSAGNGPHVPGESVTLAAVHVTRAAPIKEAP